MARRAGAARACGRVLAFDVVVRHRLRLNCVAFVRVTARRQEDLVSQPLTSILAQSRLPKWAPPGESANDRRLLLAHAKRAQDHDVS